MLASEALSLLRKEFPGSIEVNVTFKAVDRLNNKSFGWIALASLVDKDLASTPMESAIKSTPMGAVKDLLKKRK
jgi:hypothetical protein